METIRNAGSCCGHHGATSAPAHRTAAPAPQGYTPVDQLHNEINIEVRDNMLIVEGEKKNETEDKDEKKGYYRMERSYGSFRRVLSLPEDVETDKITATHKDGVLSIEIPRKEPEKPAARKIEVVKGE